MEPIYIFLLIVIIGIVGVVCGALMILTFFVICVILLFFTQNNHNSSLTPITFTASKLINTTPSLLTASTLIPNINYAGNDNNNCASSLEESTKLYNDESNCKNIVKNNNSCWFKNNVDIQDNELNVTNFKLLTNPIEYTIIPNFNCEKNDIENKDVIPLEKCKKVCNKDLNCKDFVKGNKSKARC